MNTYIYGPKDDPYHSAPNWRLPYPEKEAAQLQELVNNAFTACGFASFSPSIRQIAGRLSVLPCSLSWLIPNHEEGYYLAVNDKEIILAGNDERGTYYAIQTFAQLLKEGKLPEVEIKDYPSVRLPGSI